MYWPKFESIFKFMNELWVKPRLWFHSLIKLSVGRDLLDYRFQAVQGFESRESKAKVFCAQCSECEFIECSIIILKMKTTTDSCVQSIHSAQTHITGDHFITVLLTPSLLISRKELLKGVKIFPHHKIFSHCPPPVDASGLRNFFELLGEFSLFWRYSGIFLIY